MGRKAERQAKLKTNVRVTISGLKARARYQEIAFSEASETGALEFLEQGSFIRPPQVSLTSEGTLSLMWRDGLGKRFTLVFLNDQEAFYALSMPQYSGICEIDMIMETVDDLRAEKILGF